MSVDDLQAWFLGAAVLAVVGWYFFHVFQRLRDGIAVLRTLPGAVGRALDDAVPFWLRMVRAFLVVLMLYGAALLVSHKFGFTIYGLG